MQFFTFVILSHEDLMNQNNHCMSTVTIKSSQFCFPSSDSFNSSIYVFFVHIKLLLGSIPTFALSVPVLQVRDQAMMLHAFCLLSVWSLFPSHSRPISHPLCFLLIMHLMHSLVCLHLFVCLAAFLDSLVPKI